MFKIIFNNKVLKNKILQYVKDIHIQLKKFHRFNWYELVEHPYYLIQYDQYLDFYVSELYRLEQDGNDKYKLLAYTDVMDSAMVQFTRIRDFKTMDELINKYLDIHIDWGHIINMYDEFLFSLDKDVLLHLNDNYFNGNDPKRNLIYQYKKKYSDIYEKKMKDCEIDTSSLYYHPDIDLDFLNFFLEIRKHDLPKNINEIILKHGSISMIETMFENTSSYTPPKFNLARSISEGNIEIIKAIIKHRPDAYLEIESLEMAIQSKKLEVVKLLNETYGQKLDTKLFAMDTAIKNGSLDIVEYLHYNRTEGCTPNAFIHACSEGHIEVAKFLLEHRKEVENTKIDADGLAESNCNYMETFKFLIENDLITNINYHNIIARIALLNYDTNKHSREEILDYYFQHATGLSISDIAKGFGLALHRILTTPFRIKDFIDVFKLSEKKLPDGHSIQLSFFLEYASSHGTLEIVKFIIEQLKYSPRQLPVVQNPISYSGYQYDYTVPIQPGRLLNSAVESRNMEIVKYIYENYNYNESGTLIKSHVLPLALDNAASFSLEMVVYLHEHNVQYCTTAAMDNAILSNHLDIVKYLHENRTEGCSERAMSRAIDSGNIKMVKWLYENRTEEFSLSNIHLQSIFLLKSFRMAEYFLESNTDLSKYINQYSQSNETLHQSIVRGQLSVLRFVHQKKIQNGGFTKNMLQYAIDYNHFSIAKYIIDVKDWKK